MPTPDVIERVRDLQTKLAETKPTASTAPVVDDLKKLVDAAVREPTHAPHYTTLRDRLRLAYAGFETDHPKLASAMERVISELTAAGL
jgi:hypothetical protein